MDWLFKACWHRQRAGEVHRLRREGDRLRAALPAGGDDPAQPQASILAHMRRRNRSVARTAAAFKVPPETLRAWLRDEEDRPPAR